ncbi:MAG: ATP cone domain-containing protein, partial [Planctomycetota bacterium]
MIQRVTDGWSVKKRDGRVAEFDRDFIEVAVTKAFRAEQNLADGQPLDDELLNQITQISEEVTDEVAPLAAAAGGVEVEKIQDFVEMGLMRHGHFRVARRYIVYRAERAKRRALLPVEEVVGEEPPKPAAASVHVDLGDGSRVPFDAARVRRRLGEACRGLEADCPVEELLEDVMRSVYDGIAREELMRAMILSTRSRIERDPAYDTVASRLIRMVIHTEALGRHYAATELDAEYRRRFQHYLIDGVDAERLDPKLREFDLAKLSAAIDPSRDELFKYLGLQTIYDRYLLHVDGRRIETPQYVWMRVAMGLAVAEDATCRDDKAIEFYQILSSFRFTSATPTLFNAGTLHPQLSSCYLTTVQDDLDHIFKSVADNAKLSKWAGGLGNDWTNIRATNSHIKGTNGKSQGVIPFLKVVNDTAIAVNQGGKRKGAVCSYLETWHLDVEEFLDLRKNTGDDRRRTHDMHTANWIP